MTEPTKLTMRDADREMFLADGNSEAGIEAFIDQAQAEGATQAEFDARIDEIRVNVAKAKEEYERQQAEFKAAKEAEERKMRRDAFAGMALQGLLANPDVDLGSVSKYARAAAAHADGLLKALDASEAND